MSKPIQGYPFECALTGAENFTATVIKLTQGGLLVSVDRPLFLSGTYKAMFVLPIGKSRIDTDVVVTRIVDKYKTKENNDKTGNRLAELTFKNLSQKDKVSIYDFLLHLRNQKKSKAG